MLEMKKEGDLYLINYLGKIEKYSKLLTEIEQKDPYFEQQGFKAPSTLSVLPLPENKGRLFNIIKAQGVQWKGICKADKENKKRNASGHFVPLLMR